MYDKTHYNKIKKEKKKVLQSHTHSPVAARLLVFKETIWLLVYKDTTETRIMETE